MAREKDVSTRLIKPTLPMIDAGQLAEAVERWDPSWETDAGIQLFDEGIAQYLLVDPVSHVKFFAALVLGKPSLRCRIITDEPEDVLDEQYGNTFQVGQIAAASSRYLETLKQVLSKRGYRFSQ